MSTRALYGGSFDPIHLGHLAVIEIAARAHDELVVVVLANPAKPSGLFTPDQRVELLRQSVAHLSNVTVTSYHGLIVDAAEELGAHVLIRSAHKEIRHERSMAAMNATLSGISSSFIVAPASTASISSSTVRTLARAGRLDQAAGLVPEPVATALREFSTM